MSLRSLAEWWSRGVVLRRRLPAEFGGGRIYLAPESMGLRAWRRDVARIDPTLLGVTAEFVKPGATVWDIGANVGLCTFSAAYRAGPTGKVIAIEPDGDNVRLLLKTRAALDPAAYAPIDIVPAAIGLPGQRLATFNIADRCRSANSLAGFGGSQMGGIRETRIVATFSADELLSLFPAPQFLKVDIEGAEVALLSGATRLLSEARPVLTIEVDPSHAEEVARILHGHRYRLYDADAPAPRVQTPAAGWNCLAIPEP